MELLDAAPQPQPQGMAQPQSQPQGTTQLQQQKAQLELIKVIGRGAYGVAMLCRRKKDGVLVVVKKLFPQFLSGGAAGQESLMTEIHLLSMLRHSNVIAYLDSFSVSPDSPAADPVDTGLISSGFRGHGEVALMIVMEYANGGTLEQLIQDRAGSYFDEDTVLFMFCQILLGLHHIHSYRILHRDLKSNNILIVRTPHDGTVVLKISDFGIAKVLHAKAQTQTVVGTPSYLSPELCEGKSYNEKSDIWALGCVLGELICLRKFFQGSNLPVLILKIMQGAHESIPETMYSSELCGLLLSMVQAQADKRPDTSHILANPLLQRPMVEMQVRVGSSY